VARARALQVDSAGIAPTRTRPIVGFGPTVDDLARVTLREPRCTPQITQISMPGRPTDLPLDWEGTLPNHQSGLQPAHF
jgi:hypothetical protein